MIEINLYSAGEVAIKVGQVSDAIERSTKKTHSYRQRVKGDQE